LRPLPCSHQLCIGLAEVRASQGRLHSPERQGRRAYLRGKTSAAGAQRQREISGCSDRQSPPWRSDAGRSRSHHFGYVVCSWRAAIALRILQSAQRTGWLYLHDAVGSGGASARNLAHRGRADSSGRPLYRQALVWPSNKKEKTDRRGAVIPFHEFSLGWPGCAAAAAPFDSLTPWSRPCPPQGPGFASQRRPTCGLAQNETPS